MKKIFFLLIMVGLMLSIQAQDTIYTIHYQTILSQNIQKDTRNVYFSLFQDTLQKRFIETDEIAEIHYFNGKIDTLHVINHEKPYLTYSNKGWRKYTQANCPEAYRQIQWSQKNYKTSYALFGVGCSLIFASVPVYFFTKTNRGAWLGAIAGVGAVTTLIGIPFYIKGNKHYDESIAVFQKKQQEVSCRVNLGLDAVGFRISF